MPAQPTPAAAAAAATASASNQEFELKVAGSKSSIPQIVPSSQSVSSNPHNVSMFNPDVAADIDYLRGEKCALITTGRLKNAMVFFDVIVHTNSQRVLDRVTGFHRIAERQNVASEAVLSMMAKKGFLKIGSSVEISHEGIIGSNVEVSRDGIVSSGPAKKIAHDQMIEKGDKDTTNDFLIFQQAVFGVQGPVIHVNGQPINAFNTSSLTTGLLTIQQNLEQQWKVKLDELQSKILSLTAAIAALKAEKSKAAGKVAVDTKILAALREKEKTLEQAVKNLTAEKNALNDAAKKTNSDFEAEKKRLNNELELLRKVVSEKEEALKKNGLSAKERETNLATQITALVNEKAALQAEHDKYKTLAEQLQKKNEEIEAAKKQLESQLADVTNERNAKKEENTKLQAQVDQNKKEIQEKSDKIVALELAAKQDKSKAEESNAENQKLKSDIKDLSEKNHQLSQKLSDDGLKLSSLDEEHKALTSQKNAADAQAQQLQQQVSALTQNLKEVESARDELQTKFNASEKEKKDAQNKLQNLSQRVESEFDKLSQSLNPLGINITKLQNDGNLTLSLEGFGEDLSKKIQHVISSKDEEIKAKAAALAETEQKKNNAENDAAELKKKLEQQTETANAAAKVAEETIKQLSSENESQRSELDGLKGQVKVLTEQKASLENTNKSQHQELLEQAQRIGNLNAEINGLTDQLRVANEGLEAAKQRETKNEEFHKSEMATAEANLIKALQLKREAEAKLASTKDDLNGKIAELQSNLIAKVSEIDGLNTSLAQLKSDLSDRGVLSATVVSLQNEKGQLSKQISDAEAEKLRLLGQIESLNRALEGADAMNGEIATDLAEIFTKAHSTNGSDGKQVVSFTPIREVFKIKSDATAQSTFAEIAQKLEFSTEDTNSTSTAAQTPQDSLTKSSPASGKGSAALTPAAATSLSTDSAATAAAQQPAAASVTVVSHPEDLRPYKNMIIAKIDKLKSQLANSVPLEQHNSQVKTLQSQLDELDNKHNDDQQRLKQLDDALAAKKAAHDEIERLKAAEAAAKKVADDRIKALEDELRKKNEELAKKNAVQTQKEELTRVTRQVADKSKTLHEIMQKIDLERKRLELAEKANREFVTERTHKQVSYNNTLVKPFVKIIEGCFALLRSFIPFIGSSTTASASANVPSPESIETSIKRLEAELAQEQKKISTETLSTEFASQVQTEFTAWDKQNQANTVANASEATLKSQESAETLKQVRLATQKRVAEAAAASAAALTNSGNKGKGGSFLSATVPSGGASGHKRTTSTSSTASSNSGGSPQVPNASLDKK